LALTIKELEKEKIVSVASKYFEGFTLYEAAGFWKGQQEKTAVIEIETDEEEKVKLLTTDLLKELKQEALGVLATGEKMDFITLKRKDKDNKKPHLTAGLFCVLKTTTQFFNDFSLYHLRFFALFCSLYPQNYNTP
jgi:hypothetical protein